MESAHRALSQAPAAEAAEFVRFCYQRRRSGWPELYDEMCAVAGRGLFRGWGSDELAQVGIGLSLFELPALAALATEVIAQEAAESRSASTMGRGPTPIVASGSGGSDGTAGVTLPASREEIAREDGWSDRAGAHQAESAAEQPEVSRLILPGGAPAVA